MAVGCHRCWLKHLELWCPHHPRQSSEGCTFSRPRNEVLLGTTCSVTEGHPLLKKALETVVPTLFSTPVSLPDPGAGVPGGAGPSLTHQAKQPRLARGVSEQEESSVHPELVVQPWARGQHESRASRPAHQSWQTCLSPLILQKDSPSKPVESSATLALLSPIQKGPRCHPS